MKWCFNCVDIFDPVTNKCNSCGYQHGFNAVNKRVTDEKPCPNNKCGEQVKKASGGQYETCKKCKTTFCFLCRELKQFHGGQCKASKTAGMTPEEVEY